MHTIHVKCPKCSVVNSINELPQDGLKTQCQSCQHTFKVIPKTQPQEILKNHNTDNATHSTKSILANFSQLLTKATHTNTSSTDNSSTSMDILPQQKVEPKSSTLLQPDIQLSDEQLSHESTKIDIREQQIQEQPITEDRPQNQFQVTSDITFFDLTPTDDHQESNTQYTTNNHTVNNIVFTLLPAQSHELNEMSTDVPLLLNDTIEKTDSLDASQQNLTEQHVQLSREINWTLASLAALTVLIVQLFYLAVM